MGLIKIENKFLENICWTNAYTGGFLEGVNTDVWRIRVSSNLSAVMKLKSLLTNAEKERASRYRRTDDSNRLITSRISARLILTHYLNTSAGNISFAEGINQKPFVGNPENSGICFNISHSGDFVLMSICSAETGADIEYIKPGFEYADIVSGYFSDSEVDFINEGNSEERFFLLWTRKEALLKGTAKGLDDDFTKIPALEGAYILPDDMFGDHNLFKTWHITSFRPADSYIASVATTKDYNELRFFDFDMEKMLEH